jgi:hypothetical protein
LPLESWSGIRRRGSATSMRRRQQANWLRLPLSTIRRVPWKATPHRNSIPMLSSSTSPSATTDKPAPCSRRSYLRRNGMPPAFTVPSWRCGCRGWAMSWSAANMGNRRSRDIRKSIWRPAARAGSRSKTSCERWDWMEREPRRLLPTERGTARNCSRRERCWSGTASWPRSMGIRPTGWWLRHAKIASATFTNPTESRSRAACAG